MSLAYAIPTFVRALTQLQHVLSKAEAHAKTVGWDPAVLLGMRLAPDMFPLTRQVQIATDLAKNGVARMIAGEAPKFADEESTFAELNVRLANTIAYLNSVPREAFVGAEQRAITVPTRARGDLNFVGDDYFYGFVIPNVFFHTTTAYAIVRHAGVPVGKVDFIGPIGSQG
jgi:uncharacterized protein